MNFKDALFIRIAIRTTLFMAGMMVLCQLMTAQTVSYPSKAESLPCLDKEFSIFVHVIEDSLGNHGISEMKIRNDVEEMNALFEPICARFSVCNVEFYPTYQFKNIWKPDQIVEMDKRYFVRHVINLYVIESQILFPDEQCGFGRQSAVMKPDSGSIFVLKGCINPMTIAHQLGHYFGLIHTWTGSGTELVDGSNCATEGDLICDTPADPFDPDIDFPPFLGDGREDCLFIYPETDANGEYYRPDVGNIMSAYLGCYCGFTRQQLELMALTYMQSVKKKW
ncbi:MAG: hypothetical protein IPJ06_17765 [Saprospiraceae bacterium]|nr:hypothetical protein [Saprospiraceae bacterium]